MEIFGYTDDGLIGALIEGQRFTIPDDPENRHRILIAEWEAEGNVIPAYVLPSSPSNFLPLKPYQFWGAVRALGYEQDLKDWVAAIADPVEKGIASAMLEYSLEFRRDHPLMETARLVLGMSEVELDTLWLWGLTL